jgi:hypothetical protein
MANLSKEWKSAIPLSEWDEAEPIVDEPMESTEAMMGVIPTSGVEELYPEIGGTAGGIIGGIAGAPLGPGGVIGGATLGATLGGAGGEVGRQYVKGEEIDARKATIEGGWQGVFELGGGAFGAVLGKIAKPLAHRVPKEATELQRWFGGKTGEKFTSGMMTDNFLIDSLEKMSEKSMFGGQPMQLYKRSLESASDSLTDIFLKRMHSDLAPDEVGRVLQNAVEEGRTLFNASARTMYGEVDSLVKGAGVDLRGLKQWFSEEVQESMLKGVTSKQMGDSLAESIGKLDDFVTFSQAQKLRSELWAERTAAEFKRDYAGGLAKKALGMTDSAMEEAAKGRSQEALKAWRAANKFYKIGKDIFNNKFIRAIANKDPELLAAHVFQPKKISNIRRIKTILKDDPGAWKNLKSAYAEKMFRDATSVRTGETIGNTLKSHYKRMGDDVMKEVWSPEEYTFLKNIASAKHMVQKEVGGGGGMVIQIAQGGAVLGLVGGVMPSGASLSILVTPWAMGKVLTRPTAIKWLTEGLKVPVSTPHGVALSGRIVRELLIETEGQGIEFKPY